MKLSLESLPVIDLSQIRDVSEEDYTKSVGSDEIEMVTKKAGVVG